MPLNNESIRKLGNTKLNDLSDQDISALIHALIKSGAGNFKDEVVIAALLAESNRRSSIIREEASNKQSKIAIVIALVSLVATLTFSILDWRGDALWQEQQVQELRNIKEQLILISKKDEK